MSVQEVLAGTRMAHVECCDNLPWLKSLPDGCVHLVMTSPPYGSARTYGIGFRLDGQDWVDWMVERVVEMCRVTQGLVCVNAVGPVKNHCYQPLIEWLCADLTRNHGIVCGPAPYVYFRFGIPGSGCKHYHRRDWEPVYCFCLPDRLPLSWSDNTAEGHPPKWAPGGEMSNRLGNGTRVNQWGATGERGGKGTRKKDGSKDMNDRPSHVFVRPGVPSGEGLLEPVEEPAETVNPLLTGGDPDGSPVLRLSKKNRKVVTIFREGQHSQKSTYYDPPAVANPGNVVREKYDAEEVRNLLEQYVTREIDAGDVIRCLAGGGLMGSKLAHHNEAPFPERLPEFFIRSYCPPGGVVLDPFAGSGTTLSVAVRHGRRALGCDVRASQCEIARLRVSGETPDLFACTKSRDEEPDHEG